MRDYAKALPKMWHGKTMKALRRHPEGLIVALYLMTSPSSNMLGLFSQPLLYMAYETGLGEEGAMKGLRRCIDAGFCSYDEESEFVWVHEMASYQIAPELKGSDLRCKGIQKDYDALPDNPFLGAFFDRYQAAFHLTSRRAAEGAYQGPSKPLRSQEQEQEQEQEKEQEQDRNHMSGKPDDDGLLPGLIRPVVQPDPVETIFGYWQKVMESPRSKLDAKRRKAIKAALALGYSPGDLCRAIRGCSKTPHNMGQNDRNQVYNGIDLIFRNADQIDRFLRNDDEPPAAAVTSRQPAFGRMPSRQEQAEQAHQEFLRMTGGGFDPDDGNTIDMEAAHAGQR